MTNVRPLSPADFEGVADLFRTLHPTQKLDKDPSHFALILDHPGTTVFGCEVEGLLVSMATLHLLPNMSYGARPYGVIENVVTLNSHRGLGYARATIKAVLKTAMDRDAYKVMLLTGRGNNAIGFYEKLGFSQDEKAGMIIRF
jgi:ribosomal protein S18 acetylase RimI-like enzyme